MTCCSHCEDAEDLFNTRHARRDLRRYRRRGPSVTTRLLIDVLRAQRGAATTLLDIGGGVGAISHELLSDGLSRAVQVDASAAYLAAAAEEATRLGHRDRIDYHHGDFVALADTLPPADIVTLDRVVCCYPDLEALVNASTARARRAYGLVYPRDRALTRLGAVGSNTLFRIRRSAFRTFIHPPRRVDELIRHAGFDLVSKAETILWRVAVYARA